MIKFNSFPYALFFFICMIFPTLGSSINGFTVESKMKRIDFQTTQQHFTVSGTIKDTASGETLLGANLIVKGQRKGVSTNEYGFYSITLPQNTYTFQVSYLGYVTQEIEVNLSENKKIDISLSVDTNQLDAVEIVVESNSKSQVKSVLTGVSTLKAKEIKKLPALLGEPDITRVVLTQAGVSTIGEGASGFNVRGGNIDQNLILLDEAPIYNSSHAWGFFSIFNADAIKKLTLYKGGIPARFGGRASSVLDIRQREGSDKQFKGEGGIGVLFSRLTLEGPIKKDKLSFLVSGRRSYFDLFFPLSSDEEVKNNKIFFYDFNTKLSWTLNDNNKLFVSGYFGADVMKLKYDGEEKSDGTKEQDEQIDFQWKNTTTTVRWNHIFSPKLFMNVSGIYSRYNYSLSSENDSGGGPVGSSGSFLWKSSIENFIFKPDFTFYKNSDTKIRFGLNSTLYKFSPAKVESGEKGVNSIALEVEKGLEIAPYVEYEKKWNQFSMNAGLRYSLFSNIGPQNVSTYDPNYPKSIATITETTSYGSGDATKSYSGFEPRLALSYSINDRKGVKLGFNRMYQYIHLISNTFAALPFDIWKPAGTHLKPLIVNQLSLGYAYDTENRKYNFSVEGYFKTFENIVEYKDGADLFLNENLETQLLPAKGDSYGIEFGAYKTTGKLTGHFNYTYSATRRKTTSSFQSENISNGDYYPSNFDRPHILNLTSNYKLNKKWDLGLFFTYQTGRPTTYPTGKFYIDGTSYLTYSDRNKYRNPDTHRLDLSFNYASHKPNKKWQGSWSFGVYNVYGRKNAFSTYSTLNKDQFKAYKFSVIGSQIPFIAYNFKF